MKPLDIVMMGSLHHGIVPQMGDIDFSEPPDEDDYGPPSGYTGGENITNPADITADFVGWPMPVPVRPERWDVTPQPATYRIAGGDTFSGLAGTYLGSPNRWKEIWDVQPQEYRWNNSPDVLAIDQVIRMPDEARDNLLNWIKQGKPTGTKPGELPPETIAQKAKRSWPIVAGVGVAVIAGYFILKG